MTNSYSWLYAVKFFFSYNDNLIIGLVKLPVCVILNVTVLLEEDLSIKELIDKCGIKNITDDSMIKEVIIKIINANPESVSDYKAGHDRAIKYLMGQVMKETKGGVNPKIAMDILTEELNK